MHWHYSLPSIGMLQEVVTALYPDYTEASFAERRDDLLG